MSDGDFRRVGKAYSGTSKKGNRYLHIKLNPDLFPRLKAEDIISGMYIFTKKDEAGNKEYQVMAPLIPRQE